MGTATGTERWVPILNREHSSATSRYPNGTRGYPVHTVKSVDSYPEAVDKMLKLCNLGMLTDF